ncbi:MAG: hypothetical protein R3F31_03840 [Verrucomicrobiales bacterium]|nr:hypothetical protein [Verrucomicrobiae bacterium]
MNSPRFTYWARLLFLPGVAVGLTSCVSSYGPGLAYGPPRYAETVYRYGSSSFNRYDPSYRYDSFGYRDYHDYGGYGYGYPFSYSRGYPYGYRRDYHDHDDDRRESDRKSSSSGSSSKSKEGYKIVAGSTGSKTRPEGYHSVGWYNSKGYDVNKLKLESRDGDRYRKSSSSSSSASKSRDSGGSSRSSSEHRGGSGDHRSSGSGDGRSKSSGGGSSKSSGGGSGRGIKK